MLSFASSAQECDSSDLKDINLLLSTGINCCENLLLADSIIYAQDSIISAQAEHMRLQEEKRRIITDMWNAADSNYRAAAAMANQNAGDVQRLKKGKRNWQLVTAIAGLAILVREVTIQLK